MRTLLISGLLGLSLSTSVYAEEELGQQINTACERHAISLSGEIQSTIARGLTEQQVQRIRASALASCNAYLGKSLVHNETARAVVAEKAREERIEKESLQEKVDRWLTEEPERNAGHDRLKKR